jgi:hypothetical protein
MDSDVADALREMSRQVRWVRHAIERLLAVLGLLCGAGLAVIVAKIILWIAG